MSALPGLFLGNRSPMGQINWKTTQQGISRTASHHRQRLHDRLAGPLNRINVGELPHVKMRAKGGSLPHVSVRAW